MPGSSAKLLDDENDPARQTYLAKFADREGREFITRFYRKYQGKPPDEDSTRSCCRASARDPGGWPRSIAPSRRTPTSTASAASSPRTCRRRMRATPRWSGCGTSTIRSATSLTDRGFVAGVHPLELWVVAYLRANPGATYAQVVQASAEQRQEVYGWLFRTRNKNAQDARIRQLVEIEAFLEVHKAWARLGYPFASIVPSYATALGASADRPAALAELMGILVNDGVRMPTVRTERLHFARGTPYETVMSRVPTTGEQVMPPEVARLARKVLNEVVEQGTATRMRGVFKTRGRTADHRGRQDRHRRPPLRDLRQGRRGAVLRSGQPLGHVRLLPRRPPLRHADGVRARPRSGAVRVHQRRCRCRS